MIVRKGLGGLKIEEPVFRVRVALAHKDIQAYGEVIPLQPGMLLTADVVPAAPSRHPIPAF